MRNSELVSDIISNIAEEEEAGDNNPDTAAVESVENLTNIEEERIEEVEEEDRHSESNLENEAGIEDGVTAEEVTQD
jgi:hypothetical protein